MRLLPLFVLFFSINICAKQSAIDNRMQQEESIQETTFSIIPHKPTYILPFVYNDKIQSYDAYPNDSEEMQQMEIKFQFSLKVPLAVNIAELPLSVYFAYTQASFWQAYDSDNSSPFRETNYEPELYLQWHKPNKLSDNWKFQLATLGLTHQSNGRSDPISRSWNRLEARFVFENEDFLFNNDDFVVLVNPWYRFKEADSQDDNPDLLDYYGHGSITFVYKVNQNTFSLVSRNNLESGFSKGSVEASWRFPIHKKLQGYVQIFSGYGNSLIEYNQYTNTIGLGISLTDWL